MTWTARDADLLNTPVRDRMLKVPPFLRKILERALFHRLQPKRIWIFGSRARGNARENSDYDLAFEVENYGNWDRFCLEVSDDPPSLHKYDLVNFVAVEKSLRDAILREGVLIYES